ncbi:MAG: ABC transporter ATP-binding protein, partial [Actinobacteria bacterium]|nr:ABC transporter ATP-binding protein [Actinomycetota bacterium]
KYRTNSSIVLITHDLGVVAKYANRVLVMYAGKPVEFSTVDNIYYRSMHPYTMGLMNSITRLDEEKKEKLKPITGSPPSLIDLPEGCVFRTRCDYKIEKCKNVYPPFIEIEEGHFAACHRAADFLRNRVNNGRLSN